MFKNLSIYKLGQWPKSFDAFEHELEREVFASCGETQQKSVGWVPLRGEEYGVLADPIGGQWLARFCIETRSVPAQALKEAVEAKCKAIEAETGRHPGKKERRDLKDEALIDLLPRAFPKRTTINVWIRPEKRQLVIGTDSQSKVDEVINSLVHVAGQGFTVAPLQTKVSPQGRMASWFLDVVMPDALDPLPKCTLKGTGDEPEKAQFERIADFYRHASEQVRAGNLPIRMSLCHEDHVNFDLTDKLTFKAVKLVNIEPDPTAEEADRFDIEIALWTGSLAPMIDSVVDALGGEIK